MSAKIFIDGEAGTTGLRIREFLAARHDVEVVSVDPQRRKDIAAKRDVLTQVAVAVLCLPDAAAREMAALVADLGNRGPRLLDASTAHRVAPDWTYGFPELAPGQDEAIARARRVSNPGCYATGAIALLRPIVDAGLLAPDFPVAINATSGYSGGGRAMIEAYEAGAAPPFELYGLGLEHKHVPEIQTYSRLEQCPIFTPSVGNFRQGMLVSIPLFLDRLPGAPDAADLEAALSRHYAGRRSVRVTKPEPSGRLAPEALNGGNELEVSVWANAERRQAVLVARLDNLGKGAAGAAMQNLELMLGLS